MLLEFLFLLEILLGLHPEACFSDRKSSSSLADKFTVLTDQ